MVIACVQRKYAVSGFRSRFVGFVHLNGVDKNCAGMIFVIQSGLSSLNVKSMNFNS